ncbi:ribonuclease T [Rheinheimera sp. MMS21-TC3]|uniref:ribonuclease T n=1 Tax=Rheinheimera sp. MMS21-TC3 TaxID=3072790 RepID=UPI0028C3FFB8|nr:ribonuclease T [Rheinheimera sp. MMS21-TC3]WNO60021.1 ribonuclease T [Rheinheimera sp. MMS21-TC3]
MTKSTSLLAQRFRGYYPVVIDVETAGFNPKTDALLEIAATLLKMDDEGNLLPLQTLHFHVEPFDGANLDASSLAFNGIDPFNPLRGAVSEREAISEICKAVRKAQKAAGCQRSVIVAHNAAFDQGFVNAAIERLKYKRSPFHAFVSFDTTTLSALALGQTVLAKACQYAGIAFDSKQAHSALYDTERTAELFCHIVNKWRDLGGWPLASAPEQNEEQQEDESTDKNDAQSDIKPT